MMNLSEIRISWYGLLALIGIVAGFGLFLLCRDKAIKAVDVVCGYLLSLVGLAFGAKILHILTNREVLQIDNILGALALVFTGFSFYGAVFGSLTVMWIYCRVCKIHFGKMAEMLAFALCAIYIFARIGCTLTGCCYGIPYEGTGAVYWGGGIGRFPVQILDSLLHVIILTVLFFCRKCGKNVTAVFLLSHSADRFCMEFFRAEETKTQAGMLSVNQWISIAVFLVVLVRFSTAAGNKRSKNS